MDDVQFRKEEREEVIDQLKSFCRGEMSAVETYDQVIRATHDPKVARQLRDNANSHDLRVMLLCDRIRELGGQPPEGSGPWGAFVRAVETTATAVGEIPALNVLEEGEGHGLRDYNADLDRLDPLSQQLVLQHLVPQQIWTHTALTDLVRSLA